MECPELTIVIDGYGDCVARSLSRRRWRRGNRQRSHPKYFRNKLQVDIEYRQRSFCQSASKLWIKALSCATPTTEINFAISK